MDVGSPRTDAQGTVGDGREREVSDVAGTFRRSDTAQGVSAAVSFTISRASATSVLKSGSVSGINFGRVARRSATAIGSEGVANDSDGVLGTEAGKVHDGPSNLARGIAARPGNLARGIAARPGCYGGTNAAADSSAE